MGIDVNPSHRIIRTRRHLRSASPVVGRRGPALDHDYWIGHCEGYRVETHEGRLGFVDEVRENPADPDTPLLAIRAGMLGRRIVVVAADEVHMIAPRTQQIWLRAPVRIADTEAA
jgi:hypothetical protein